MSAFIRCRISAILATVALGLAMLPAAVSAQAGAAAWVVVDTHSARILLEQNGNRKRSVDGFAGVATALVTLDWAQRTGMDLGARVAVPMAVASLPAGNPMGLQPGDRVTMRDLVYSVTLGADDAACLTLASVIGQDLLMRRQRHGDPVAEFVKEMNYLAAMNGMSKTRFGSPHGGPLGRKDGGMTTTRDLARLAMYAMSNPGFRFYSMQSERAVAIEKAAGGQRFRVRNYNRFAGQSGVDGVKAVSRGFSGPAAILTSKRNPEVTPQPDGRTFLYPRRVVAVVDGGSDPAGVAWQLLSAGWQEFDRWTSMGRPTEAGKVLSRTGR